MIFILSVQVYGQQSNYDVKAINLLDSMSLKIGELSSCSLILDNSFDVEDMDGHLIKYLTKNDVCFSGQYKMMINITGDKGHQGYWYNGKHVVYYNYDQNNYGILNVPPTTIETIDSLNRAYGIDIPAADFFYPTFTDDLIENSNQIICKGKSKVNGKECSKILAIGTEQSIQIWIEDKSFLPMKFIIMDYSTDLSMQYEGTISEWKLNPILQDSLFEFTPPANANKLKLIAK
jgi:hypothetical protein